MTDSRPEITAKADGERVLVQCHTAIAKDVPVIFEVSLSVGEAKGLIVSLAAACNRATPLPREEYNQRYAAQLSKMPETHISEHGCFDCNGLQINGVMHHDDNCPRHFKGKPEPKPETWRDRKPLI